MRKLNFIDGIIIFILTGVTLLTIGSYFQSNFGKLGLFLSQITLLIPSLIYIKIFNLDFKETFRFNKADFKEYIRAFLLWLIGFVLVGIVGSILMEKFPQWVEPLQQIEDAVIFDDNIILNIFIVALMPSICEELVFRGIIMTSFKRYKIFSVLISALFFGLLHIYPIKIIPTAIIGFVIGYSVYKSNSIYTGMFIHFINNSFSIIMSSLIDTF